MIVNMKENYRTTDLFACRVVQLLIPALLYRGNNLRHLSDERIGLQAKIAAFANELYDFTRCRSFF